mmetsp:Transcript_65447/g.182136  ORF Transcript_65447/g.182136 Transcript_65447/m.182136 type:complete len:387 (+) Transcript_65447:73-1233(+)
MQQQNLSRFIHGVVAALLPFMAFGSIRVREALLCEARHRFEDFVAGRVSLEAPKSKRGVTLHVSDHQKSCGGNDVPITYGEFDVEGASPLSVFNVLTDSKHALEWNKIIRTVDIIGEFPEEGAIGVSETYPSGIFVVAEREIFQWYVFNASAEAEEYWLAFSTLNNDKLHAKADMLSGDVAVQNCLGAYYVKRSSKGSHVFFTQHVNPHPPVISQKMVFELTWGKQVDFIDTLRFRAKQVEAQGNTKLAVKDEYLHDDPTAGSCGALGFGDSRLFDASLEMESVGSTASGPFAWAPAVGLFAIGSGVMGFVAITLRRVQSNDARGVELTHHDSTDDSDFEVEQTAVCTYVSRSPSEQPATDLGSLVAEARVASDAALLAQNGEPNV